MVALRRDGEQSGLRRLPPRTAPVLRLVHPPGGTRRSRSKLRVSIGVEMAPANDVVAGARSTADDAFRPLPRVRGDALPEHTEYRDTGCDVSESCLRCPLARCKYDEPGGGRSLTAAARNREIVLLRERYRAPINLLASTYGVTRRTVFRALREARLKEQAC
jgi:hypothetical protein